MNNINNISAQYYKLQTTKSFNKRTESVFFTGDLKNDYFREYQNKTAWEKKKQFAFLKSMRFSDRKLDTAIVILGIISLFIHPLLPVGVILNIGLFGIRYIQGLLKPEKRIDKYWQSVWSGKSPNIHDF